MPRVDANLHRHVCGYFHFRRPPMWGTRPAPAVVLTEKTGRTNDRREETHTCAKGKPQENRKPEVLSVTDHDETARSKPSVAKGATR